MGYSEKDIKNKTLRNTLVNIGKKLTKKLYEYNITTIYIIGSSISSLINGKNPKSDIDFILCFKGNYTKGIPIINKNEIANLRNELNAEIGEEISFQYNGIDLLNFNNNIIIDIIPLAHREITEKSPQVTIDLCRRDRILLLGTDILNKLDDYTIKDADVIKRIEMAINYIHRDVYKLKDSLVKEYMIKSIYYFLSLIFIHVSKSLDKNDIIYNVKLANLPVDLSRLSGIETNIHVYSKNEIEKYFIDFTNIIKSIIDKNGLITGHNRVDG